MPSPFSAPTASTCSDWPGRGRSSPPPRLSLPGSRSRAAILFAGVASALIGMIAVRTAGIYTIMITLAVSTALFYFAQQNYSVFNGHAGFRGLAPPQVFGVNWHQQIPFYYLTLGVSALAYVAVVYGARSTFGRALMATRDNQRRMRAIGYDVTFHRVAAYFLAGIIAGTAGVLYVWF